MLTNDNLADPLSMSHPKALETIGTTLQKQYERWQPRARYKQSLDPTVDEVKKLCTSLRRNAKEERVLFHYNGHGVPKPTVNGEIWVFNRVNYIFVIFATHFIYCRILDVYSIYSVIRIRFANLDGGAFNLCLRLLLFWDHR